MELNTILDLMAEWNLTADELLLVYLTLLAQIEESQSQYLSKWYNILGKDGKLKELFNSLKEKGVILKNYKSDVYNPDEIEFNKFFIKKWYKVSKVLGMELFDKYPIFLNVSGKFVPAKNISKRFNSLEDFSFFYGQQIKHNPDEHKRVLELLQWGIDNDKIHYSIIEFVVSKKWNELQYIRDNNVVNEIASTFDTFETI